MAEVLRQILPKVLPKGWDMNQNYFIRTHEGKQDLKRSLLSKLKAFSKMPFETGIVVLIDQDSSNCVALKQSLVDICTKQGSHNVHHCIRIVCHELESWYLGDMAALEKVFPNFHAATYSKRAKFRQPDMCVNPKAELKRIVGDYPQIGKAREIAPLMNVDNNKSNSFRCFVAGIIKLISL